jgi:hypothetical protein
MSTARRVMRWQLKANKQIAHHHNVAPLVLSLYLSMSRVATRRRAFNGRTCEAFGTG